MKSFDNKVAAITGAASGMGRELALLLARRGCHLALTDVNASGLDETVALVKAACPVRVTSQTLDVANREAVFAWADRVVADHGKVNLIFNNAGVGLGASIEAVKMSDFEWIMGINFWGVVYGTKAFLPYLRASGEGHIINTSSLFGIIASPLNGAYNASKFAVRGFTEALRLELELEGAPVSATCVHPGGIKTAIAKSARMDESVTKVTGSDAATAAKEFEKNFFTTAQSAAATIIKAVEGNKRRCLIGPDAHLIDWIQRRLPSSYQKIVLHQARRQLKALERASRDAQSNG
jgi:short-subunit dehydrogenase